MRTSEFDLDSFQWIAQSERSFKMSLAPVCVLEGNHWIPFVLPHNGIVGPAPGKEGPIPISWVSKFLMTSLGWVVYSGVQLFWLRFHFWVTFGNHDSFGSFTYNRVRYDIRLCQHICCSPEGVMVIDSYFSYTEGQRLTRTTVGLRFSPTMRESKTWRCSIGGCRSCACKWNEIQNHSKLIDSKINHYQNNSESDTSWMGFIGHFN